jgi:predicted RNA-binding protein with PIN domain
VPEPTLYLFDGFNLLHAGGYESVEELIDRLASFVAQAGARGVVVFDGVGDDLDRGPLQVRWAKNADTMLERLAAEHRDREAVCLVSSDTLVRGTSGVEVQKLSSATFLSDLSDPTHQERSTLPLGERLDEETRARLERLRRGQED